MFGYAGVVNGLEPLIIDVERRGVVAVDKDDLQARYAATGQLKAIRPALRTADHPVRLLVEVLRRFSGMVHRALLGAEFIPIQGMSTVFEVNYVTEIGGTSDSCPSRLWRSPFITGLPEEFASAVLSGLTNNGAALPAGVLRVDRGGFDRVESPIVIFRQAAQLLRCALAAKMHGVELDAEVRGIVETW